MSQLIQIEGPFTTAERDTITAEANPQPYWMIFNSDRNRFEYWTGSAWKGVQMDGTWTHSTAGSINAQDFALTVSNTGSTTANIVRIIGTAARGAEATAFNFNGLLVTLQDDGFMSGTFTTATALTIGGSFSIAIPDTITGLLINDMGVGNTATYGIRQRGTAALNVLAGRLAIGADGATTDDFIRVAPTVHVTAPAGQDGHMYRFGTGHIDEAGSGTHGKLITMKVEAATVDAGAATVTDTATFYIDNAMSATVTGDNYAVWVDAGKTRLDGDAVLNSKVTTYNAIATEGNGLAPVHDLVALTGQTADIGSTNFTNCGTAGLYRVSYVLEDTTADVTAGTLTLTLSWTDGAGATTATATQVLTATGRASGTVFVQLASGNLSYATSHTGIFGSAVYALYMTAQRLN